MNYRTTGSQAQSQTQSHIIPSPSFSSDMQNISTNAFGSVDHHQSHSVWGNSDVVSVIADWAIEIDEQMGVRGTGYRLSTVSWVFLHPVIPRIWSKVNEKGLGILSVSSARSEYENHSTDCSHRVDVIARGVLRSVRTHRGRCVCGRTVGHGHRQDAERPRHPSQQR